MNARSETRNDGRRGHGGRRALGAAFALLALLGLGGCLVPTLGSAMTRDVRFEGVVRRADTGAAVPGANVEVWLDEFAPRADEPASLTGQTGAGGEVVLRGRFRSRVAARFLAIRVTPPAGSGLAARSIGGGEHEGFFMMWEESGGERVIYTTGIVVEPASAAAP